MKKVLITLLCTAGIFSACSKKDYGVGQNPPPSNLPVTFKTDSSVLSGTVQAPKNNQLIFAGNIYTGSINSFNLTSVKLRMKKNGDGAETNEYLKRIRLVVEGNFSGVPFSMIKDSVSSNEFTFSNFVINFAQYQIGAIKIYADILSSATNGSGLNDDLSVDVGLTYTGYLGNNSTLSNFPTSTVSGHKTTFSSLPQSFVVASVADPATPISGIVLHTEDKKTFSYSVNITGVSGSVTEHRFLVQGLAAGSITALKLYDGNNNFIAQANVSGGVATIVTNDALSAGMQKAYSIKPVVNVMSGDVSRQDFTIVLDAVKAVSVTNEQKTDGTNRVANPFTVFKSFMSISQVPLSGTPIVDSVWMNAYRWTESASSFGSMATKNRCFGVTFVDNGIQDTLQLVPEVWKGSTNITSLFYLINQNGDTVNRLVKSDTKLFLIPKTGGNGGESITTAGSTDTYTLRFLPRGFKHTGDGYAVAPVFSSTSLASDYKFIVGTLGSYSKMSTTRSGSGGAQLEPWIVSDMSSLSHSALVNLSSNDWFELTRGALPEQVYSQ